MIKVAFWYDRPQEYSGGINYIRNLLHAVSVVEAPHVVPYVFFGTKVDDAIVRRFEPLATVVRTSVLDRLSPAWFIHKLLFKTFGSLFMVNRMMKQYDISVMSHSEHVIGTNRPYRLISWIPDFQYLHLPGLFPGLNVPNENARLVNIVRKCDVVVISSNDALADFKRIMPVELQSKATVLQFVSQPASLSDLEAVANTESVDARYSLRGKYFFLPNQFWHHKNHAIVFEAVKILKQRGQEIVVVCTGNLKDYRSRTTEFLDSLMRYLDEHGIVENVRILGLISYPDVLHLMRNSVAVINPSRFEGWSSSVEEAKSIGKKVILSDIGVHREQQPEDGVYFSPDDAEQLATILLDAWNAGDGGVDHGREAAARNILQQRTMEYGLNYLTLIDDVNSSKL